MRIIKVLDKNKLLEFLTARKDSLYYQITRDFGGGIQGRVYEHSEAKFWKEAIERGEFDGELPEIYIILSQTQPEIVEFTFYTDKDLVEKRVEELNKIAKKREYWYITIYSSTKNAK